MPEYPLYILGEYELYQSPFSGNPEVNYKGDVLYCKRTWDTESPPEGWKQYAWFKVGTGSDAYRTAEQKSEWESGATLSKVNLSR